MTTPQDEQDGAEPMRDRMIQSSMATGARAAALEAIRAAGADLASAGAGATPELSARMDEAGFLLTLASLLLADPNGRVHRCAVCQRFDRPVRPLGQLARGGPHGTAGLRWACRPCLGSFLM
jgi:hypothetical protein